MDQKMFEQRTYEGDKLIDTLSLTQLWSWTSIRTWAEGAGVGEKFGFTGQTYLIRVM